MRLAILSDLHLEFHRDKGRHLLGELAPAGVDVLVVAGDLSSWDTLPAVLGALCDRFAQVVYVLGNHEHYGSSFAKVRSDMRRLVPHRGNLHWLDNGVAEIAGRRFVGTTLWHTPTADDWPAARFLSDFSTIEDFADGVGAENSAARAFLHRTVRAGDVVVTHHLPSRRSVAPRFASSPLNRFFVCDLETLIQERQPALWVHGHTHVAMDYRIGATRVVCNPLGYPGENVPGGGRLGLVLEVEDGGR